MYFCASLYGSLLSIIWHSPIWHSTEHFLLRCQFYSNQRLEIFENLEKVVPKFLSLSAKNQVLVLLHGSQAKNFQSFNEEIIENVISYLKAITRFDRPLVDF